MAKKRDNKQFIRIRGANEHNLKNIDLDIPRNELVVLTGLSGSGKSSHAFRVREIVPGFRYYLCGRAEKIYGVTVFLCQTVPGADGEAGCGEYRGIVAGDFYRPEINEQESKIYSRDSDRDLRLFPASLCQDRNSALS